MIKPVPLGGSIIVKMVEEKNVTEGGIILSDGAVPKARQAVVILVGPGRVTEYGVLLTPAVEAGDVVYLKQYAGIKVTVGDTEYTIIEEPDIVVKFVDDGEEEVANIADAVVLTEVGEEKATSKILLP